MLFFYSLALAAALVLGAPYWLFRMAMSGKYREGLGERLGHIPERIATPRAEESVIWVHAVSVGELLAAARLIEELRGKLPDWRIVISTTTRTGQTLARQRFGAENVFYFPLDFAFAVRAWMKALHPRLLVLMETEFWPRLLTECYREGIPVAVVNARISDRSWPRYFRLRFLWKHLLGKLSLVMAQTGKDAERLHALGAANVSVAGNLKYDIRVAATTPVTEALVAHIDSGVKVLVCGSTLEGEESVILDAAPQDVLLVIAPRHPERFEAVAQLLAKYGRPWVRRSQWMANPKPLGAGMVFLLDSIGELASVYSLASVAFVGGSLVAAGGHNPLEPAQFCVPVVMGPHYENFGGVVGLLRTQDAIRIASPQMLAAELEHLLIHEEAARAMGERAHTVFASEAGATGRAVEAILSMLETDA